MTQLPKTHPFQKQVEKARAEVAELEQQLMAKRHFLEGLEEALKFIVRSSSTVDEQRPLRAGSDLAKCADILSKSGRPLYVGELLKAIGKEDTKENRLGLAGSLSQYVRAGKWFVKTGPNIFGLLSKSYTGSEDAPMEDGDEYENSSEKDNEVDS